MAVEDYSAELGDEMVAPGSPGATTSLVAGGRARPFAVAEALRCNVRSRRGAPRREVERWLAQLLVWQGLVQTKAEVFVATVLDALIEIGDIGVGSAFGQEILVPTRTRFVLSPDCSVVLIGGNDQTRAVPAENGALLRRAPATGIEQLDTWTAVLGTAAPTGDCDAACAAAGGAGIALGPDLPDWLRRAVILAGRQDLTTGLWRIDPPTAALLGEWAGLSTANEAAADGEALDPDQRAVVEAAPDARLIVEAGPGSGKTHVACQRIVRLIEDGVAASRIWLLSFTRIAVEEIRQRAAAALVNPFAASAINVATFDSFAWQINSRFGKAAGGSLVSYDASIRSAVGLLQQGSMELRDFIGTLEHVVIDEAQDLTGSRLEMVELFLGALPDGCGVTVFGDSAQAIYDWQERGAKGARGKVLSDKPSLLAGRAGYRECQLRTDHRTTNRALAELYREARGVLGDTDLSPEMRYDEVRRLIEDAASGRIAGFDDPRFPKGSDSLVLYRGRRPLLATGHTLARQGKVFRIRLADRSEIISSWLGGVLAGVDGAARLQRNDLSVLLDDLPNLPENLDEETMWSELLLLSGAEQASVAVADLCDRFRSGLPVRFVTRFIGRSGPIFSTIHGAKGQEADRVVLMLPNKPMQSADADIDWAEEARILYVGATRAKRELLIGSRKSGPVRYGASGRTWRGRRDDFSVEIGLQGDVSLIPDGTGTPPEPDWLRSAARELSVFRRAPQPGLAVRDARSGRYSVHVASDGAEANPAGSPLAYLSGEFIREICTITECAAEALPSRISGFSIMGCTTHLWHAGGGAGGARGIALAPVLTGFAQISTGGQLHEG